MVELTVPFETSFQAAAERNETNYEDLVNRARQAGYNTLLITVEVGAQGVPHMESFSKLITVEIEARAILGLLWVSQK